MMSTQQIHSSSIEYRIIFGDTDAGGIVYHPRYLELSERGRNELMRDLEINIGNLFNESNVVFALRSSDMKFHSPAFFDDKLTITTRLERLTSASSVWVSLIRRGGTQVCTVRADIICMNRANKKAMIYPDDVLKAFEKISITAKQK